MAGTDSLIPDEQIPRADTLFPAGIAMASGIGCALTGIAGLAGLYLSLPQLSSFVPGTEPISFTAAVLWIILGFFLCWIVAGNPTGYASSVATAILIGLAAMAFLELPFNINGTHFFTEVMLVQAGGALTGVPVNPISPVTDGLVILVIIGLIIILNMPVLSRDHPAICSVSGLLGLTVSFISFVFLLSYGYGSPFFYGTTILPISVPSSCALFLLGIGLSAAAGPTAIPLKYFIGDSTQAVLLRASIPMVIVIILSEELLHAVLNMYFEINDALISASILGLYLVVTILVFGDVARYVGRGIDISERKRREAELELRAAYEQLAAQEEELRHQYEKLAENQQAMRQREEQYRAILRTAMDGFCLVDMKGAFLDVNDAFCEMLGYPREEMLKKTLRDIEAVENPEEIDMHKQKIMNDGTDRFQTRYRCSDGRVIDTEVSVVFTGSPSAPFFTFHRDITDQVRVQRALEQAKKKINLLNLVTFNDIQNALFSLTGYLQLVKAGQSDPKLAGFVEKQEQITRKISDTLGFAHSYQDMGMKPPRWQNLSQVFLIAISHLNFSRIQHRIDVSDLEIFADPLLEQVLEILAANSLVHGGDVTQVSLFCSEETDGLRIIYEDNGTGIPEEMKSSLFTRDFLTRKGTGLFLAREILEITGISIRETGICGNGARFEMFVPKDAYRFSQDQAPSNAVR